MLSDSESELQCMITKLNNVCKEYCMDINVKKTKTFVSNKSGHINCLIMISGSVLEQVSQYKYVGSWAHILETFTENLRQISYLRTNFDNIWENTNQT